MLSDTEIPKLKNDIKHLTLYAFAKLSRNHYIKFSGLTLQSLREVYLDPSTS